MKPKPARWAGIVLRMASEWDDLVSSIINYEKYKSLAPLLLTVVQNYNCGELEVDEDTLDNLKQACCDSDPDWAREELKKDIFECDRCYMLYINNQKEIFRMKKGYKKFETHEYCAYCYTIVSNMEDEYSSDDTEPDEEEEDVDDKVQREHEWEAELNMGK